MYCAALVAIDNESLLADIVKLNSPGGESEQGNIRSRDRKRRWKLDADNVSKMILMVVLEYSHSHDCFLSHCLRFNQGSIQSNQ